MPRAEINNSLTGKVGKQAVRQGLWGVQKEPGGGGSDVWLESALGTADAGTSGRRGWSSTVWYRLGQKEEGLCGQTDRHRFMSSSAISQLNILG